MKRDSIAIATGNRKRLQVSGTIGNVQIFNSLIFKDSRKITESMILAVCRDFYKMLWFTTILLISPNSSQYLLSINCTLCCDFGTKLILSTNSVVSCTPLLKFMHFSYFLTKQVPWHHSVKSLFSRCWAKRESNSHISKLMCLSCQNFTTKT